MSDVRRDHGGAPHGRLRGPALGPAPPAGSSLRHAARMAALVAPVAAGVLLAAAPAQAHPWGPPPTAEVAVDGADVAIEWRSEFDDAVMLSAALGLLHPTAVDWDWDRVSDAERAMISDALSQAPALHAYLLESIQVRQDGAACEGTVQPVEDFLHSGARVVHRCPRPVEAVSLRITMLHSLHEAYRTFAHARGEAQPRQQVFTVAEPEHHWTFGAAGGTAGDRSPSGAPWLPPLGMLVTAGAVGAAIRWRRARSGG